MRRRVLTRQDAALDGRTGMAALLEGFKALGVGRLVAMAAVAASMLLMLAFLALRGGGDHMALLYADMDLREASQVADNWIARTSRTRWGRTAAASPCQRAR